MAKLTILAEMVGTETVVAGLDKIQREAGEAAKEVDQSFAGAQKSLDGFSLSLSKGFDAAKTFAVALGAIAAAEIGRFMVTATKQAFDYAEQLNDLSQRLGISTDTLQEFEYIARMSGTTTEAFAGALRRLSAVASQQKEGTEDATAAFAKYGIQLRDNEGRMRTAEDLLKDVADRIAAATTNTERMGIASSLLGRDLGIQLIPALMEGSEGFERMQQAARDLGIVIDHQLLKQAADAKDRMDALAMVLRQNLYGAILEVSPAILELSANLKGLGQWLGDFMQMTDLFNREDFPLLSQIRVLQKEIKELEGMALWERLTNPGLLMRGGFDAVLAEKQARLRELQLQYEEIRKRGFTNDGGVTLPGLPELPALPGTGGGGTKAEDAVIVSEELARKLAVMGPLVAQEVAGFEALNKSLETFAAQGLASIMTPLEQLAALQTKLNEAVAAGMLTTEQASAIYAQYAARLDDTADMQTNLLGGLENSLTGLASATVNSLGDMENGWESFGKTMQGVAASFVQSLLKMILAETLLKSIGGAITGLFGTGVSMGSNLGAGGVPYPLPPMKPGLATGGSAIFTRPSLLSVAEYGPELVEASPLTGGSRGEKGGTVINQVFNGVQGEDTIRRAVAEGLRKAIPGIVETSVQMVRNRNRMDPNYMR